MLKKCKYIVFLIVTILIFNNSLFSQIIGKIEGKVTDIQTGFPIENVNVFIENTNYGTVTNVNGNFQINNIQSGEYKIIFSHISYVDEVREIEVIPEKRINLSVEMSINIIKLKEVVTESKAVHSFINKLPEEKVKIINIDDMNLLPSTTIGEVLKQVSSLKITNTNQINQIMVRGNYSDKVLFLLNGNTLAKGNLNILELPISIVKSIEILPESGSAYFGEEAVGGVININTKESKKEDQIYEGSISYGKYNRYATNHSIHFNHYGGHLVNVNIIKNENDFTYKDSIGNNKTRKNNGNFNQQLFYSYNNKLAGQFIISGNIFAKFGESKIPGSIIEPLINSKLEHSFVSENLKIGYNDGKNFLFLKYINSDNNNNYTLNDSILNKDIETDNSLEEIELSGLFTDKIIKYSVSLGKKWEEYSEKNSIDTMSMSLKNLRETSFFSGAADIDINIFNQKIDIFGAVREDKIENVTDKTSWEFGGTIKLSIFNNEILGNYSIGTGFKLPDYNSKFSVDGVWSLGNPDLKPETRENINWQVGFINKSSIIDIRYKNFQYEINDAIIWNQDSTNEYFQTNLPKAINSGYEISVNLKPIKYISINGSYSEYDFVNNTTGEFYKNRLPYKPSYQLFSQLQISFFKQNFIFEYISNGESYEDIENKIIMESYDLYNFSTKRKLHFQTFQINVSFTIKNLFDEDYEIIHYFPMPGRTYEMKLGVKF
ncbi:MAG: carboxypeptidase-like regulatory domain-containing protein [Candidatus Marinimicrobia bacterium]|nr:carboxypeptidase-like regulatory domain-containing protein [Candidatus Neomarinimicrobiota bacterium]